MFLNIREKEVLVPWKFFKVQTGELTMFLFVFGILKKRLEILRSGEVRAARVLCLRNDDQFF